MSMRDFMTRVLNTPIATPPAPTPPRSVARAVSPIVVEIASPVAPAPEGSANLFHWDVECRSAAVLGGGKQGVGARAYAEHPTTEILCISYARGNGAIKTWLPGQPVPEEVFKAAAECSWVAHNAAFERALLECILVPQYGWPTIPIDRHVCTMSLALAHAYPGSLEAVAAILGLMNQKDTARERIVRVLWKPRRGEDPAKIHWVDTPELRAELHRYNRQDVAVERELHRRLRPLPAAEQDTWVLDAEINDYGVLIDAPLAQAAAWLAAQASVALDAAMQRATDGAVDKATKNAKLKAWLASQGVRLPEKRRSSKPEPTDSLDATDIEMLLAGDLPPQARTALEIRLQAAQSAASKIDRMLISRCADGRVRNLYKIYGAHTGRWSGAGFQPQNLKRPELLQTDDAIAEAIALVLTQDYVAIKQRYGDVLGVIGDLARSMIIPAPGHRFIIGDFSAVEARVLPFLAGDAGKLEAFRLFDLGLGRDLYCTTAEQVLGLTEAQSIKSPERQLGKIFELGLGFGMGPDKLLATIRKANIPGSGQIARDDCERWVKKWRTQNPAIVGYWAALEAAAITAVRYPGTVVPCRKASFTLQEGVLFARLPSGRELSYPAPTIEPGRFVAPARSLFSPRDAGTEH
jgi:DNA polymerase